MVAGLQRAPGDIQRGAVGGVEDQADRPCAVGLPVAPDGDLEILLGDARGEGQDAGRRDIVVVRHGRAPAGGVLDLDGGGCRAAQPDGDGHNGRPFITLGGGDVDDAQGDCGRVERGVQEHRDQAGRIVHRECPFHLR